MGVPHESINRMIDAAQENLGGNLRAIILFGSANNDDFIEGTSDLDFLYLCDNLDSSVLGSIRSIRENTARDSGCAVDIKPFTLGEFKAAKRGVASFEFFTGWGLEAILRGQQRILYNCADINIQDVASPSLVRKHALERAHYYMTKYRALVSSSDPIMLRGISQTPKGIERVKIAGSAAKNILAFILAHQGIFAYKNEEVLSQARQQYGDILPITELLESKSRSMANEDKILHAYDRLEQIYSQVTRNA